jgi:hypothetical protein
MPAPAFAEHDPDDSIVNGPNGPIRTRACTVVASSRDDAFLVAEIEGDIVEGAVYKNYQNQTPDPGLGCVEVEVRTLRASPAQGDPPDREGLYEVIGHYEYAPFVPPPLQPGGPAWWYWISTAVETPTEVDKDGVPNLRNAADQFWDPLPNKRIPERVLVAEWLRYGSNLKSVQAEYFPFEGRINETDYQAVIPGSLYLDPVEVRRLASPGLVTGLPVYHCTARFLFRQARFIIIPGQPLLFVEGWQEARPNMGTRTINPNIPPENPLRYKPIPNAIGQPVSDPVPLNAAGTATVSFTNVNFIVRDIYTKIDFAAMGIPDEAP